MQPIIHFENFTFQYDSQQRPTLRNIDLTIYAGEKVCIVGPSGSGKSTLAHCINGLIPERYEGKFTGKLELNGEPATSFSLFDRSKQVGTVLQDTDSQFIGLTVAEDIAFALENDMVPKQQMKELVQKAAEQVEIADHLNNQIFELSGGQKQRTAMAGVLVNNVDILLFDEPLANLDPATGKSAMALIERLHNDMQKTIILVEHRLEDVLSQPIDRIILMNNGQIVADLPPADLLQTDLLEKNDIREPLYIRLLKYAGVDVSTIQHLDQLEQLNIEAYADKIHSWFELAAHKENIPPQREEVLRLNEVSFTYAKANSPTLHNINLQVQAGEFISIVGTNGAGKSTLAKCICGFEKVKQGNIDINGANAKKDSLKSRAEKVGFVLQNPNQMFSQPKIYDEVAFGLRQRNVSEPEIQTRVFEILKVCGLYPFRNWPIAALSYGQKRRVAIAAILVLNPSIIILDEPTAGQDYKHAKELMDFLHSLTAHGTTILVITHDMHLMTEYTNRTIVVHDGQIIADKKPSQVLTDLSLVKQAYLKESSLYTVATKLGFTTPFELVECFIQYERGVLAHGK
jgi:energy-coupling factor transport system ATP-binding protein